ncbi:hypothetical protein BH23ACT12_BH23ACT12_24230 [soil metagenome]
MAPFLSADWRVHARVEITDEGVIEALTEALETTRRISLISAMEHSFEKSRFASAAAHRSFYAQDWGVTEGEVDAMMARKVLMGACKERRREQVAEIARTRGITLAGHDIASAEELDQAKRLGATVCEFPLTIETALHARRAGMVTVLGAPNALRGRSTSRGNLLVADAVKAGACSALCSDYLPHSLLGGVFALHRSRTAPLEWLVDMVAGAPAAAIGLPRPAIRPGELLNAVMVEPLNALPIVSGIWRDGRMMMSRCPDPAHPFATAAVPSRL